MTNQLNSKPMSDDELEAVSGGISSAYAAAHTAGTATTAQNATPVSADTINSIYGTGSSHSSPSTSTSTSNSSGMPGTVSSTQSTATAAQYQAMGLRPPNETITTTQNGVTGSTVYNIYD